MNILSFLVRKSPGALAIAIAASLVGGISDVGFVSLTSTAVHANDSVRSSLAPIFITLCIISLVTGFISRTLSSAVTRKVNARILLNLGEGVLTSDLRHIENIGNHALLASFTEDLNAISNGMVSVPSMFLYGTFLIGCLVYIGWLSRLAILLTLAVLAIAALTMVIAGKKANRFLVDARKSMDILHSHLRALTYGTKELKMHRGRRQEFLANRLKEAVESFGRQSFIANIIYTLHGSWAQFLYLSIVFLLVFPLPAYLHIDQRAVIAYTMVLVFMMSSIGEITNRMPVLARSNIAIRKLNRLTSSLKACHLSPDLPAKVSPIEFRSVCLEDVKYVYQDGSGAPTFSVGPISLTLHPGEVVFLMGGNGSGKSTLVKLVVGLYQPSVGHIYLNGCRIDADNSEFYREQFSVVFADFYLFASLMGLGQPGLDEKANELVRTFKLADKVRVDSGKFSTTELSQGQRKRLALITAYLEDRPVCVFDEWAAEQDIQFKKIFYLKLLPELKAKNKIIVVVTHDDEYSRVADRIVKLSDGKVASIVESRESQMLAIFSDSERN